MASAAGICGYFIAATLLQSLHLKEASAVLLPSFSIVVFSILFRATPNVKIEKRVSIGGKVMVLRSLFAACFILLITSTARLVGTEWAGLFAAFPVTMLPFVLIIHFTYDLEHVHAILKNVPRGLGALLTYSLVVSIVYPLWGIYTGTAIAYAFATLYLILIEAGTAFLTRKGEQQISL